RVPGAAWHREGPSTVKPELYSAQQTPLYRVFVGTALGSARWPAPSFRQATSGAIHHPFALMLPSSHPGGC
ncbi:hypothetical protein, partial [Allomeiothermus silvanus]|uniref:hypothetical protein n=1 Tax=Allomeiothermus silvanus TaxID=52022 RepID=UPI0023F10358